MGDYHVKRGEDVRVSVVAEGWDWRCDDCGWLGVGLSSPDAAEREALRHVTEWCPQLKAEVPASSSVESEKR